MRVVMISDVHCTGSDDPVQQRFVQWLDELDADALWLLGDVFHWGWAFDGHPQAEFEPVFEALDRLVARGLGVVFVPGNHDFALGPVFRKRLGADVEGPHTRVVDDRRIFLSHGDEVDRGWGVRLLRWFLRGWLFSFFVGLLGPGRGTRLLQWLAGERHPEGGAVRPESIQYLSEALVRGADLAVMGHVHQPLVEIVDGEGTCLFLGGGIDGVARLENGALMA